MRIKPIFLQAEWRSLIMANFEVSPEILFPFVPLGTELDTFEERHFVSIVGFIFEKTKILGIPAWFHSCFEELNLRFYVTYLDGKIKKRGTVFISEIVPKPLIPLLSNTFYNERYSFKPMRHFILERDNYQKVRYEWKSRSGWNFLEVEADITSKLPSKTSFESFITEHYWGYNTMNKNTLIEYGVEHVPWEVFQVSQYDFRILTSELYGTEFEPFFAKGATSVFLAKGSDVVVRAPNYIKSFLPYDE